MCVLGAQKDHLIGRAILKTHIIWCGLQIRKIIFKYAWLSGGLVGVSMKFWHILIVWYQPWLQKAWTFLQSLCCLHTKQLEMEQGSDKKIDLYPG